LILLVITSFFAGCSFLFFGNTAPVIDSTAPTTVKVGYEYTYNVSATDLEGDVLTYSLIVSPDDMEINSSTGKITWIPTEVQIGENEVTVKVSDKWHYDTQTFIVTVSKVILTSIEVLPAIMSLTVGNSKPITSVTANYDYGESETIALSACSYESSNKGVAIVDINGKITGKSTGSATITVSYTEGDVAKTDTVTVTVTSGGG